MVDRKPVDPPPIIRLQIKDLNDPAQYVTFTDPYKRSSNGLRNYLQSPYYMMVATLWDAQENQPARVAESNSPPLAGTLVSSLHKLKDNSNEG